MQKDKIDFIVDLLADNRIEAPLKEKVSDLATRELKRIFSAESENRERILEIERKMLEKLNTGLIHEIENESKTESKKLNYPFKAFETFGRIRKGDRFIDDNKSKIIVDESLNAEFSTSVKNIEKREKLHKPKDVAEFLYNFRRVKTPRLKFLTHKWDLTKETPLTYEVVVKNAIYEFWECSNKYTIPAKLFSKILEFVYVKSVAFKDQIIHPHFFYLDENVKRINIYKGWSSDEMKEWAKTNPNKDPNGDDYWLKELINPFKNCIEVRAKTLKKYLNDSVNYIYNDSVNKLELVLDKSLEDARFFTDVPILFEGIREILSAAKTFAEENNINPYIKISYDTPEGTGNYGIRQITIITSKNIDVTNSFNPKSGGNFGAAFNHFWGLCNWSIICRQNEKLIKYNVISDEENIIEKEILEHFEPEGFTHILTFFAL